MFFSHVVIQLSCYSCASILHAERHVVSTCSHLHGVLHQVASFCFAALACALPPVTIASALRDVGGRRLFACGNPSVFACGYMDVWICENLFCPLTKIDVKPISARWGINFII
jgi:hypothetical protein